MFEIEPINRAGPPTQKPDPRFPMGRDADLTAGRPGCTVSLPYPAPERLMWSITCRTCGATALVTAAGRVDDPRQVKVPCRHVPKWQ